MKKVENPSLNTEQFLKFNQTHLHVLNVVRGHDRRGVNGACAEGTIEIKKYRVVLEVVGVRLW